MERIPSVVVACALGVVALSISGCAKGGVPCIPPKATQGCPMAMNTGAVGSCMFSSCSASRGPTVCHHGTCYCVEGYCRYPASTIHVQSRKCRALVPDSSCHLSRTCWKGGLSASSCVKGACMCRSGMHIGCDGKCHSGWAPLAMSAANASWASDIDAAEIDPELEHEENIEALLNVSIFFAWVAASSAMMIGGVMFLRRKLRTRYSGPTEYKELPDDAAPAVA